MAVFRSYLVLLALWVCASSPPLPFAAAAGVCPRRDLAFLDAVVRSQCPLWIQRSLPLEVNGETLDKELSRGQRNAYYSVLFYASWCPFSRRTRPTFDALSMMFPQIKHLAVEESFALPSLFSRHGVHSFPSIVVVNGTRKMHYHGSKDLSSLVLFYKRITGLDPTADFSVDQSVELGNEDSIWLWNGTPREILTREPYLAFSVLFLCFKAFFYFFPEILSRLKALWFSYVWQVNWAIFGEWNQLLERAIHIVDVKRLWSIVRLSNKTRNFQKGANNARAWASTLTSVSLGESSSLRSAPTDL
uniref:5'-adenylylsulfate reductase-like 5 n=1 Tax=Anthurium amnicola TaxID=1678845 RepID=A0A1D1XLD3_9ARAE